MLFILLFSLTYFALVNFPQSKPYTFFDKFLAEDLNIYTFGKVGQYYKIGLELDSGLEKNIVTSVNVKETDGSKANLFKVTKDANSIGFCQSDVYFKYLDSISIRGNDTLSIKENVTIIDALYKEKLHVITECPNGDCTKNIELQGNLKDDTLIISTLQNSNIGEKYSGTRVTMTSLITYLNKEWESEQIDLTKLKDMKVYDSLIKLGCDSVKCTALVTSEKNRFITEHISLGYTFLGVNEKIVDNLNKELPGKVGYKTYNTIEIKKDEYKNLPNDIPTIGVETFLIANKKLAGQIVDATIKHINDNSNKGQPLSIIESDRKNNSDCINAEPKVRDFYKYLVLFLVFVLSALVPFFIFFEYNKNQKKIKNLEGRLEVSESDIGQNPNQGGSKENSILPNSLKEISVETQPISKSRLTAQKQIDKKLINEDNLVVHQQNTLSITYEEIDFVKYIIVNIYITNFISKLDKNKNQIPVTLRFDSYPDGLVIFIVFAYATKIDKSILSGKNKWIDPNDLSNQKTKVKSAFENKLKSEAGINISLINEILYITNNSGHKLKFDKKNIEIDNELLKLEEVKDYLKQHNKLRKAIGL